MRWLAIFVAIFLSVADGSDDGLCARQLEHFTQSLRRRDSWALELFDTWTKLQSGLASRNAVDFGHFDQCVDFMHAASSSSDVGTIRGQYCLVYYRATRNSTHDENDADFQWTDIGSFVRDKNLRLGAGFCLPASCSVQQVQAFVGSYLSRADLTITADYDQSLYCRTSDSPSLETVDIVAIAIFAIMAALLVSSTVYEVLMIHRNRKRNDFLVAFSLYRNGKKLFEMRNETSPNVIKCLSGLRTFAMLHIMFGHRYLQWFASPNINPRAFALGSSWSQSFMGSLVHMHPIAVDTFFVMGGLLLAKSILSAIEKKRFNIPRMYLHRYIRTMPVLAFLILYTVSLLKFAGEGPIFVSRSRNAMIDTCKENYWATLLYIHNYYNPVGSCMEVSWYLAADFQLVLVSPLIVYPIYKWGWKVLWVLPAYIAGTVIWVFVVAYAEEFLAYTQLMPFTKIVDYYETLYGTALIRCAPWMVGIIVGYYLHKLKGRKIQINKFLNAALWIAAISVLLAITLGSAAFRRPADENSIFANALFLALERQSWGLAIAWIIFGCEMGGGGPVRKFLELPCWQPLGRMSLSFYLVHIFVSFVHLSSIKTPLYFSDLNVWTHLCADFLTSAAAAAILYLTFEEPVLHIESSIYKWIATRKGGRDSEAKA